MKLDISTYPGLFINNITILKYQRLLGFIRYNERLCLDLNFEMDTFDYRRLCNNKQ